MTKKKASWAFLSKKSKFFLSNYRIPRHIKIFSAAPYFYNLKKDVADVVEALDGRVFAACPAHPFADLFENFFGMESWVKSIIQNNLPGIS